MRRTIALVAILVVAAPVAQAQGPAPRTFLRWPHERADLSEVERRRLRDSVFLVNNFGLYQGSDAPESVYFHDGLDIVLPNGTPLYAIAPGYVRAIIGQPPYRHMIVEDAERPGWAWQYVHIDDIAFRVGEFVPDGAALAVVSFVGLEHVHLNRVLIEEGGSWNDVYALSFVQSIHLFEFNDTEPPTIQTPFRYFINDADLELRDGSPVRVSGEVDIVAAMRDGGQYAHGNAGSLRGYGDRLAPERAVVSIARGDRPNEPVWEHVAFDFSKLVLGFRRGFSLRDPDRVYTIFKFRPLVQTAPPGNYNRVFSYYVLTNRGNDEVEPRRIDAADGRAAWDTRALPDGEYVVTVRAWDAAGNVAAASDRVIVANR
jgi:hypothetical protein